MEEFKPDAYRDQLAQDLKSIPDHKERKQALESETETFRYKKAQDAHTKNVEEFTDNSEEGLKKKKELEESIAYDLINFTGAISRLRAHDGFNTSLGYNANAVNDFAKYFKILSDHAAQLNDKVFSEKFSKIAESLSTFYDSNGGPLKHMHPDPRKDKDRLIMQKIDSIAMDAHALVNEAREKYHRSKFYNIK